MALNFNIYIGNNAAQILAQSNVKQSVSRIRLLKLICFHVCCTVLLFIGVITYCSENSNSVSFCIKLLSATNLFVILIFYCIMI